MTVRGQPLLPQYNSPGIKDQPQTCRLLPPTGGPCLWRHREGPRTATGSRNLAMDFFPPLDPASSLGSGQPRKFCGLRAGPKWQTPNSQPLNVPEVASPHEPQGWRFLGDDGRGPLGMPSARGRRAARRRALASRAAGQRRPGPRGSLPPVPGAGGTRHTARGPHLRRALGATASPRRGRPEGASDNTYVTFGHIAVVAQEAVVNFPRVRVLAH